MSTSRPSLHATFSPSTGDHDDFGRTVSELQQDDPLYRMRSASREVRTVIQSVLPNSDVGTCIC